jgi:AraC-like DNA-binding protein
MALNGENFIRFWCAPQLGGMVEYSRGIGVTHVYPWHWHEEFQISALEEGPGTLSFRDAEYPTPPGSLLFIPPGAVHSNRHSTPGGCSYRTINLPPSLLEKAFSDLPGAAAAFARMEAVVQDPELFELFLETHAQLEERTASQLASDSLLLRLLEKIVDRASGIEVPKAPVRSERLAVRQVKAYLSEHYSENVSLEELSKLVRLSPYHLHRVFTREAGMPPHAFQTQVRIARAKVLLNERKPLRLVAVETGFSDQSHFTREFKRFVGLTPGAYRSDRRKSRKSSDRSRRISAPASVMLTH